MCYGIYTRENTWDTVVFSPVGKNQGAIYVLYREVDRVTVERAADACESSWSREFCYVNEVDDRILWADEYSPRAREYCVTLG